MSEPAKRRATYDDIVALPPHVVGEIVDGELNVSPRPTSLHARTATEISGELVPPFGRGRGGPGGWIILIEPELHFGADVLVPDLAGWRRERMPELPDAPFLELAPDWVCEVLSPSTALFDKKRKVPIYARESVRPVWLADPLARSLEVLRLDGVSYRVAGTFGGDDPARIEPFDAIEFDVATLWKR